MNMLPSLFRRFESSQRQPIHGLPPLPFITVVMENSTFGDLSIKETATSTSLHTIHTLGQTALGCFKQAF